MLETKKVNKISQFEITETAAIAFSLPIDLDRCESAGTNADAIAPAVTTVNTSSGIVRAARYASTSPLAPNKGASIRSRMSPPNRPNSSTSTTTRVER